MTHSKGAKVRAIAIAALAALAFSGCATTTDPGQGELTGDIRILANITPVLTMEYYEGLVAPYLETHPGVTITIEAPTGENVQSTLQQQLASGSFPDIVASNLETVVASQLLAFPDEEWVKATPLAEENALDGKIWQVATGAQIQSLIFYNKDAFAAAGIDELPTTLEDFTAALRKLKDAGYVPFQAAGEWVTGGQFAWMANPSLLGEVGLNQWVEEKNAGTVEFAGSDYQTWLEAYAGWVDEGLVQPDALGVKYPDSILGFTSGQAATYAMGNWVVPSIDEANPSFEVGVFGPPTLDGSTAKQLSGPAQPYSILKDSANVDLALDIVKFLVSDEAAIATSLAAEGNFRAGISYDGSPLNKEVAAVLDASPGFVSNFGGPYVPAGFLDEVGKQVQSLYSGTSPADAAAALDAWWKTNAVN